jgi:hypothetical protein
MYEGASLNRPAAGVFSPVVVVRFLVFVFSIVVITPGKKASELQTHVQGVPCRTSDSIGFRGTGNTGVAEQLNLTQVNFGLTGRDSPPTGRPIPAARTLGRLIGHPRDSATCSSIVA